VSALYVLSAVYAVAWLGFWLVEVPDVWRHIQDMDDDTPPKPLVFLMLAGVEFAVAFFWPITLVRGARYVWSATPAPGEDDEEEDEE